MLANDRGETLVEVARRVVGEWEKLFVENRPCPIPADRQQLQTARRNLGLCEAYAWDYDGQDQAREPS